MGVVESGYCNDQVAQPSYEQVCSGRSGCNEVVKLTYDPALISTREILEIFFIVHDATTLNSQGNDDGTQYHSGFYYTTDDQKQVAQDIIKEMGKQGFFSKKIVTEVLPLENYWPAEDYHQDFFENNPDQAIAGRWRGRKWRSFAIPSVDLLKINLR